MARAEDYERYAEHCLKMAGMADGAYHDRGRDKVQKQG
jgi:hypothetical protein